MYKKNVRTCEEISSYLKKDAVVAVGAVTAQLGFP